MGERATERLDANLAADKAEVNRRELLHHQRLQSGFGS